MKCKQVIQLAAGGSVLLLGACDAPQDSACPAPDKAESTLLVQPLTGEVIGAETSPRLTVPETEAEHAASIARLMAHPRKDAAYPEQVKLLTESYLKRYHDSLPNRQQAMQCFMNAILLQPERFAGKDFDRAYEFCDYPAMDGLTGYLLLLKTELLQNDYRKSAEQKDAALNTLYALFTQSFAEGQAEQSAYAHYIMAKYGHDALRREITERYFREVDSPANPYRLRMLQLAELSAEQLLPLIAESAEQGELDALLPFVRTLCESPDMAARLQEHAALAPLYYTVQLEKLLDNPNATREELAAVVQSLTASMPAIVPPQINSVLAWYYCTVGQWDSAVNTYRDLLADERADRQQVQLFLAQALVHVPDGKAEAESLFRSLTQSEDAEIALSALQGLYQLQRDSQRYNEAMETTAEMLRIDQDTHRRIVWMLYRAGAAKMTGNLTEAINIYSQLEASYSGTPAVAIPACKELMELLVQRNFKQRVDKKKGTYTPSDKWYAWVRGRDFVKGMRQDTELLQALTPQQAAEFADICKMTDELGIDYDVITEERDRAGLPLR